MRTILLSLLYALWGLSADFSSAFPAHTERVWIGPEYWANPLQDWRVSRGRLECVVSGADRNVNLLTHQIGKQPGAFTLSVRLGSLNPAGTALEPGWAGFRIGISGPLEDYRYALIHGRGLDAGITTAGVPFLGAEQMKAAEGRSAAPRALGHVELRLTAAPESTGTRLSLTVHDPATGRKTGEANSVVPHARLAGNIALVSHWSPKSTTRGAAAAERGGDVRFWFQEWKASGPRIEHHPEQTFGPILWSQDALSKGVMKMTAQMPPLGIGDSQSVSLQTRSGSE